MERTADAAMDVGEHREINQIAREVVEDEKILEEICDKHADEQAPLRSAEYVLLAPQIPYCRAEYREICEEAESAACGQPVEEDIVRPIKPWLLAVHVRIEILSEDIREIFLSPAEHRMRFPSLERHAPEDRARLRAESEISRGKARKHGEILSGRHIFDQDKSDRDDHYRAGDEAHAELAEAFAFTFEKHDRHARSQDRKSVV